MKSTLKEALGDCLARLERGESVEEALRGHESMAAELRPLLEAARAVRVRGETIPNRSPEAVRRGRARMQAERARQAERRAPIFGWFPWRAAAVAGIAAAAVLVASLGFASGLFDFGSETTAARAEGVVASAGADTVVLTTQDGRIEIRIGDNTIVLDSNGNVISGGEIVPGALAKIEFEEDEDGFAGLKIEIEDDDDEDAHGSEVEFSGVIQSIDGDTLTLDTSFGTATVLIDANTEVKGTPQVGQTVEVHATLVGKGDYLARELEVEGDGDGGDDGDGGGHDADDDGPDSSGPGSGDSDDDDGGDNSGPGGSGLGGDDDDIESDDGDGGSRNSDSDSSHDDGHDSESEEDD